MRSIRLLTYCSVLGLSVVLSVLHWRGLEDRRELNERSREEVKSKNAELEALRAEQARAEAYLHFLQSDPFALEKELREKGDYLKPGETAYQFRVAPEATTAPPQRDANVSSPPRMEADAGASTPEGDVDGSPETPPVEAPATPGP